MPPNRESMLGLTAVVFAIVTNIVVKVINFSDGEYPEPEAQVRAILNVALGLVYAVCAVAAWRLLPNRLVGWLMIAVSFSWQAGSWLRTIGDVAWLWPLVAGLTNLWAILVGVLVFCYPTGRFFRRFDRLLVVLAVVMFSVRFVVTLLVSGFDGRECTCAESAYAIVADPTLAATVENAWRLTGLALILLVSVRVIVRWFASSPPARRVAFVMPIALICWAAASVYEIGGDLLGIPQLPGQRFLTPLAISAIPIAYVTGLAHVRNLRSRVSDLVVIARDGVDRMVWQDSLARTLDDPSLRVFWWDVKSGGYLDAKGSPVQPHAEGGRERRRSLLRIAAGDAPLAVIDHDIGLTENTRLLDGVAAALRLSVDNDRLRGELEKTLRAVRESRLRIVEAGDAARAKIERDLHDGSQQVLVSVAINLRMIGAEARTSGDRKLGARLEAVSAQLGEALTELRSLARGIHPTALTEGGLQTAVRELAARSPIPVDVEVRFTERTSPVVESTLYFVIAECLTNTAKHAAASRASVHIERAAEVIEFRIADDGSGSADALHGSGLRGVIDRVEALGGSVRVASAPGSGTTVSGSLPIDVLQSLS